MWLQRFAALIGSALIYAAAMPNELFPDGSPLFGLVSVIPLLYFVRSLPSIASALRWGFVWSLLYTGLQYFWLINFGDFAIWTLSSVALAYAVFGTLYLAALWAALHLPRKDSTLQGFKPLAISAVLVGFEYLRSTGYLAFPWNQLAHPFHSVLPLVQVAAIGGVFLISFWVAYGQAIVWLALSSRKLPRAHSLVWLGMTATFLMFGISKLGEQQLADDYLDLLLVQQNTDSWQAQSPAQALLQTELLSLNGLKTPAINLGGPDFAKEAFEPSLTLWSETSLSIRPDQLLDRAEQFPSETNSFAAFMRQLDSELLTGAPVATPWEAKTSGLMNGVVLFSASESEHNSLKIADSYGKRRLIPFAEHVPFSDIPFLGDFLERTIGISRFGWEPGPDDKPIRIRTALGSILAGTPICFEDSFFDLLRIQVREGANILINLTNNSWSGTKTAQHQHLAAARFRSIENERMLIRSTNSGVSAVIDARGRILWQGEEFVELAQTLRVPIASAAELTPYTRFGDYPAYTMLLLLVLWLARLWMEDGRGQQGSMLRAKK